MQTLEKSQNGFQQCLININRNLFSNMFGSFSTHISLFFPANVRKPSQRFHKSRYKLLPSESRLGKTLLTMESMFHQKILITHRGGRCSWLLVQNPRALVTPAQ